ncbi:MAG: hydroxyphenylacetyl-CoA thioesterase PaaI [Halarcobacter sp.]
MSNSLTPKELAIKCITKMNGEAKFENHLGVEIMDLDDGYAKLRMRVQNFMLNGHGACQGGAIFSFADTSFAYACNGRNVPTVGYSCDITYIKPAFEHDILIATGKEIDLSKRNGIYQVEVTNQKGDVIAHFIGKSRAVSGTIISEEEL